MVFIAENETVNCAFCFLITFTGNITNYRQIYRTNFVVQNIFTDISLEPLDTKTTIFLVFVKY